MTGPRLAVVAQRTAGGDELIEPLRLQALRPGAPGPGASMVGRSTDRRVSRMPKLQIVFAAREPHKVAAFWRAALDYREEPPPPPFTTWDEFLQANDLPPDTG